MFEAWCLFSSLPTKSRSWVLNIEEIIENSPSKWWDSVESREDVHLQSSMRTSRKPIVVPMHRIDLVWLKDKAMIRFLRSSAELEGEGFSIYIRL